MYLNIIYNYLYLYFFDVMKTKNMKNIFFIVLKNIKERESYTRCDFSPLFKRKEWKSSL